MLCTHVPVIVLFPLPRFFWRVCISSAIFCFSASRAWSIFAWWILWSSRAWERGKKKKEAYHTQWHLLMWNSFVAVILRTIRAEWNLSSTSAISMKPFMFKLQQFSCFTYIFKFLKEILKWKGCNIKKMKQNLLQKSDIWIPAKKHYHHINCQSRTFWRTSKNGSRDIRNNKVSTSLSPKCMQ